MNIFALSPDPTIAACLHYDVHVRKMIVESAQMLSTCQRLKYGYCGDDIYKSTHVHHPCTKWVMESFMNYDWLLCLSLRLCAIFYEQTGRQHKTETVLRRLSELVNVDEHSMLTEFSTVIPQEFRIFDESCKNYQHFYVTGKLHLAKSERDFKIVQIIRDQLLY